MVRKACTSLFHLAATVHADMFVSEREVEQVNVGGTRAVVNSARLARIANFVFFSSVAVYPETEELLDEESPAGPSTPYGRTKLAAERIVFAERDSMRVTVLRLPAAVDNVADAAIPRLP